ncbi:imelysin family protein [Mucilaginibacter sp. AK015]|uniref:imelysin family protein n=1 Tax=Mucilaginibacter sp. AK015 TaxID=2723072 RepID=UPI001611BA20|nr:imelysin family protein [Mucilaginibacter sp. AK015]MBB5395793.1 putative lipoprotein [Mucilaginibacter sp. AK015]
MNTFIKRSLALVLPLTLLGLSCSKNNPDNNADNSTLKTEVLANISANVCAASYEDMYAKTQELQAAVTALNTTTNDDNLATARVKWKAIRTTWEQSEAWLFGPVESENIDPRIDTWPVDFNALETILNSNDVLNEAYVDGLDDALKGFHPIEYLLWGQNGTKTAAQLKPREKDFLAALTQNLVKLSKEVRDNWTNGYTAQLANAGKGSGEFTTQQAAFVQIADAMAGICGEVADSKLKEPFDAQDPMLEESPFAKNSITDFTNNIKGILAIYQGRFTADGKGIEDVVRANNLSLDAEIKSKHAAAIAALGAIDKPFGEAIVSEQSKVQNAMTKITELAEVLDSKLKPFLIQYTK